MGFRPIILQHAEFDLWRGYIHLMCLLLYFMDKSCALEFNLSEKMDRILVVWDFLDEIDSISLERLLRNDDRQPSRSYAFFVQSLDPYLRRKTGLDLSCLPSYWPVLITDIGTGVKFVQQTLESLVCSPREAYHRIPTGLFTDRFWLDFNVQSLGVTSLYRDGIKSPEPHIDSLTNLLRDADYVFVAESADHWEITQSGKNLSEGAGLVYKLRSILPAHEQPTFSTLAQPVDEFVRSPGAFSDALAHTLNLAKESELRKNNWKQKNLQLYHDKGLRYRQSACGLVDQHHLTKQYDHENGTSEANTIMDMDTVNAESFQSSVGSQKHRQQQQQSKGKGTAELLRCDWGINSTFDDSLNSLILSVARSAHDRWLAGDLLDPDPCSSSSSSGSGNSSSNNSSSTSIECSSSGRRAADAPYVDINDNSIDTISTTTTSNNISSRGYDDKAANDDGQEDYSCCQCDRLSELDRRVAASLTVAATDPTTCTSTTLHVVKETTIFEAFATRSDEQQQRSATTTTITSEVEQELELQPTGEYSADGSSAHSADRGLQNVTATTATQTTDNVTFSSAGASVSSVRIMCMTYTIEPHHDAITNIISTWGKRCDGYLAFSNSSDLNISIFKIMSQRQTWKEEYFEIWAKVQAIWKLAASTLLPYYDYFLIGGDDLFIIVENLKEYLSSQEVLTLAEYGAKPLYLGRPLRQNKLITYNSGGAGYILNAAALATLHPLLDTLDCLPGLSTHMEDVMVGRCLRVAGISTVDTADTIYGRHRERFHPQSPQEAYQANDTTLMYTAERYNGQEDCCSNRSISFQNIKGWSGYMPCLHSEIYRHRTIK